MSKEKKFNLATSTTASTSTTSESSHDAKYDPTAIFGATPTDLDSFAELLGMAYYQAIRTEVFDRSIDFTNSLSAESKNELGRIFWNLPTKEPVPTGRLKAELCELLSPPYAAPEISEAAVSMAKQELPANAGDTAEIKKIMARLNEVYGQHYDVIAVASDRKEDLESLTAKRRLEIHNDELQSIFTEHFKFAKEMIQENFENPIKIFWGSWALHEENPTKRNQLKRAFVKQIGVFLKTFAFTSLFAPIPSSENGQLNLSYSHSMLINGEEQQVNIFSLFAVLFAACTKPNKAKIRDLNEHLVGMLEPALDYFKELVEMYTTEETTPEMLSQRMTGNMLACSLRQIQKGVEDFLSIGIDISSSAIELSGSTAQTVSGVNLTDPSNREAIPSSGTAAATIASSTQIALERTSLVGPAPLPSGTASALGSSIAAVTNTPSASATSESSAAAAITARNQPT